MKKRTVFPYFWHWDKNEKEVTVFRVYCLDKQNKTVVMKINDFTPYCYLELPTEIDGQPFVWDTIKAQLLTNSIKNKLRSHEPIKTAFTMKKKLYYCNIDPATKKAKMFPYLMLAFSSPDDRRSYTYTVNKKRFFVRGIGSVYCKIHEEDASALLQFYSHRSIPTAGWVTFKGKQTDVDEQITICDEEYSVKWKNIKYEDGDEMPQPLILSMDIEVNSTNPSRMPSAEVPGDKVFQISCVLRRHGDMNYQKYLLTLGDPDQKTTGKDVTIQTYRTESSLLLGYVEFLKTHRPNIVTGYNILGFDIQYMIERAKFNMIIDQFKGMGFPKYMSSEEIQIKWSSSAYKNQEFNYLDAEGILHVDLLPLVRRDYKFDNYKLKTVSEHFIGQTKDPLDVAGIFRCYRIGMQGGVKGAKALGVVGKYCVQDSVLVSDLFDKLKSWVALCEMAKVCNVPIFYLYTKGQQIKVYSQVYKKCMYENRIVEKDGYQAASDECYTGAYVFPPVPGIYDKVVPFDFSSLYPTTIIAYNICFSTLVRDTDNIPDEMCNIVEWEDHIGCKHDTVKRTTKPSKVICAKRKYKFLKSPMGVLPTLLLNLLDSRSQTKKEMKACKKQHYEMTEKDKASPEGVALAVYIEVLNKRQLAMKVSANSMYGAMGVKRGYLPFLPGAMCTTAWGRMNIMRAADRLQKVHKGHLVYGDTDSNYIHFKGISNAQELWDHCLEVEEDVSSIFPPPMRMAFEEVIYWRFLILTKKRYMYLSCGRDGKVSTKIGKKGVLLARRDNSAFIRQVYAEVVDMAFNRVPWNKVMVHLCYRFNDLCGGVFNHKDFVVTKSVGNINDYAIMTGMTKKGQEKSALNKTKIKERKKQLKEKYIQCHECDYQNLPDTLKICKCADILDKYDVIDPYTFSNEEEEILKHHLGDACYLCALEEWRARKRGLPAHVQLAEKLRRRGQRVDAGERLEYVITNMDSIKAKLWRKLEHPKYFSERSSSMNIDYLHYLKLLGTQLDQVINVCYKQEKFCDTQLKARLQKRKMCEKLLDIFTPQLEFVSK